MGYKYRKTLTFFMKWFTRVIYPIYSERVMTLFIFVFEICGKKIINYFYTFFLISHIKLRWLLSVRLLCRGFLFYIRALGLVFNLRSEFRNVLLSIDTTVLHLFVILWLCDLLPLLCQMDIPIRTLAEYLSFLSFCKLSYFLCDFRLINLCCIYFIFVCWFLAFKLVVNFSIIVF